MIFPRQRRLLVAMLLILAVTPSSSQTPQPRVLEPSQARDLPDRLGSFGVDATYVEGEIGGITATGIRFTSVFQSSPFYKTEWKRGTIVWSIDGLLFRDNDSIRKYIRSIPAGQKVSLILQIASKPQLTSVQFTMPESILVNTDWDRWYWASVDRINCMADHALDKRPKGSPCEKANNLTIEQLRQNEIGILRRILLRAGEKDGALRKKAADKLKEIEQE